MWLYLFFCFREKMKPSEWRWDNDPVAPAGRGAALGGYPGRWLCARFAGRYTGWHCALRSRPPWPSAISHQRATERTLGVPAVWTWALLGNSKSPRDTRLSFSTLSSTLHCLARCMGQRFSRSWLLLLAVTCLPCLWWLNRKTHWCWPVAHGNLCILSGNITHTCFNPFYFSFQLK